MDTTSIILKTDSRGRVCMPPQRREELLLEFERSGLPATKFAQLAGVRYQTFATWVSLSQMNFEVKDVPKPPESKPSGVDVYPH